MLGPEDKSSTFLESSIKNFKIFIDTCSLLSEQADMFWSHSVPLLQREGKSIVVPLRVYEEAIYLQSGRARRSPQQTASLWNGLTNTGISALFVLTGSNYP